MSGFTNNDEQVKNKQAIDEYIANLKTFLLMLSMETLFMVLLTIAFSRI